MARPKAKRGSKSKTIKKAVASKRSKKPVRKAAAAKKTASRRSAGSRRLLDNARIAQLQKLYKSGKQSAKALTKQFKISMATLFNYLKVKV